MPTEHIAEPSPDGAEPNPPPKKAKGCGCGCITAIVGLLILISGIPIVSIGNKGSSNLVVPLNDKEKVFSVTETVSTELHYGFKLKADRIGNHYYIQKHTSKGGRNSRSRTWTTKHLAHKIPITVKAIRVSDGEVLFTHEEEMHTFEYEEPKKIQQQGEPLENYGEASESMPQFETGEPVRFELTIKEDETYKARIKGGEFVIVKRTDSDRANTSIGVWLILIGFLVGAIGTIIFIVAVGVYIVKNGKLATPGQQDRREQFTKRKESYDQADRRDGAASWEDGNTQ